MARSHLRSIIRDRAGNVIQNARANVYLHGTTTPVSDMWTAETGGSNVTTLTSDSEGEFEGWLVAAKTVDLVATDNGATAYYPGRSSQKLSFGTLSPETIDVGSVGGGGGSATQLLDAGFYSLDILAGTLADDGVTDNGALITNYLASAGPGTYVLGNHPGHVYGVKQPIIVKNGQALVGMGSMQGGSTLQLQTGFPTTTTTGGAQVTPADTVTTFTLNVAATALFPMAAGKINPAGGIGVLCMSPASGPAITVFYTGLTGTTFTGCRVGASDVGVTIPNGANVSTFAVWLTDPGDTSGGFGTRVDRLAIDCNDVAPGVGGIHTSHIQEGGGASDIRVWKAKCFSIRVDSAPAASGSLQAVNYDFKGPFWLIASSTAEAGYIACDIMASYAATHAPRMDTHRGITDFTITTQGSATALGYAGIRVNGAALSISGKTNHMECQNVGVMIGDKYAAYANISTLGIGGTWGSPTGNNCGVYLGNTATNAADIVGLFKSGSAPGIRTLIDAVNGYKLAENGPSSYVLRPDGSFSPNGGGPYVSLPNIAVLQDAVAAGSRDNSSSATLTVTFTKATAAGSLLVIAVESSLNRTVTSVVDVSHGGDTWVVDKVSAGAQGVTANLASVPNASAHAIGDTLTVNLSAAGTYASATVIEVAGAVSASPADKTATNNGSSGDGSTGVTATRSQAKEILIGAVGYSNASDKVAGGDFIPLTKVSSGAGNRKIFPIYKVVTAIGTDAATWVNDVNGYECVLVTYKAGTQQHRIAHGDQSWGPISWDDLDANLQGQLTP